MKRKGSRLAKSMTADQIERLMGQNSIDWHKTDDPVKKDQLHQQNQALAAQRDALTGGTSTFDSSTGTWNLSRMGTGNAAYQAATLPGATDYSSYVREIQSAKEAAALAALTSAYQQNVLEVDAAEKKIAPTYQAARNQTAASAAVARRNFGEYAAASGLNTGAAAQSELARSIITQGQLNEINTGEAGAYAEIALQRQKLAAEYNNAIAAARANGQADLAQMLYSEKVRLDDAMQTTAYQQAGLDYQAYMANYNARRDAAADAENARKWEYQAQRDAIADAQADRQWEYQQERDAIEDERYEDERDYQRQQDALERAYQRDKDAYDRAMEKWSTLGYLDAESARILGLPAGTRTSDQIYRTAQILHMK